MSDNKFKISSMFKLPPLKVTDQFTIEMRQIRLNKALNELDKEIFFHTDVELIINILDIEKTEKVREALKLLKEATCVGYKDMSAEMKMQLVVLIERALGSS